jgi:enamine deaminase RidA (YjgF/YER057c/UK114 family)
LSKLVVHRGVAYLAGQVADDLAADVSIQTRETLAKIDALLAEAGTDKTRILSAQIWLATMEDAPGMNAVWENWMPEGAAPARATVGAPLATARHLVEIKVVAAID